MAVLCMSTPSSRSLRQTLAHSVGDADMYIIDAATRLLDLMAQPVEAELIAPLVRDEILIRLLRGPMGSRVARIGQSGSSVQRIAKAVSWLRANFDQPANIEVLAKLVNMSVTSFHRQFKAVTGMSPFQFQSSFGCRRPGGSSLGRGRRCESWIPGGLR